MNLRKKLIGDRSFYKMVLAIAIPIMIQNAITNFVGLLDNIMVGRVGTDPMSGVAIANQLMFVFNLCIFGGVAGPGIFTAQFFGSGDTENVRHTVRFKLIIGAVVTAIGLLVFGLFDEPLISLYLKSGNSEGMDAAATLYYGREYLHVMLIGLIPFVLSQVYSGTLRETGETVLPMKAGVIAVFVNLFLNYVLIYGKFGAPAMGVVGAAVATVISRFVEMFITVIWTHRHTVQNAFAVGLYRTFRIPGKLLKDMTLRGLPLLINEGMWSLGMTMMSQQYSLRGLEVVGATNISQTIFNLFNVASMAMGSAIAIILGQQLGAGALDRARDYAAKLAAFTVFMCVITGVFQALIAPIFPQVYNTTDGVRHIATGLILIQAIFSPLYGFENACYFTIRSGGKTVITFIFDSCAIWLVNLPTAALLIHFTSLPILAVYTIVQCTNIVKSIVGFIMVRKGIWVKNLSYREPN